MKVKELIQKLSQHDPELEVLCYSKDESLLPAEHIFRLIEIEGVSEIEGKKCRGDDGVASLKLGKSQHSQKHITINITTDF